MTVRTDRDWEPILKKASGVVTDQGGRTCHAAIIAREMGITAIVLGAVTAGAGPAWGSDMAWQASCEGSRIGHHE